MSWWQSLIYLYIFFLPSFYFTFFPIYARFLLLTPADMSIGHQNMSVACRVKTSGRTDVTFPIACAFFSCIMCKEHRRVKDANSLSETRTRWNQIVTILKYDAVTTNHAPVTLPFWKMFSRIAGKTVGLQGPSINNYGHETFALLSYYPQLIGNWLLTFHYHISVSASMAKQSKESLGLLDP